MIPGSGNALLQGQPEKVGGVESMHRGHHFLVVTPVGLD